MGWRVQVLPFLDEAPLYDKFDDSGHAPLHAYESVDGSVVPVFQCPSTARFPRTVSVHRDTDGNTIDPISVGAKDYNACCSVRREPTFDHLDGAWCSLGAAYSSANMIRSIRDGLSSTFLLTERADSPVVYIGRPSTHQRPFSSRIPTDNGYYYSSVGQTELSLSAIWPSRDALLKDVHMGLANREFSGLQVNRRNDKGIYAMHSAGAYASYCDGHVDMLAEETDKEVVLALFSRDSGEEEWD